MHIDTLQILTALNPDFLTQTNIYVPYFVNKILCMLCLQRHYKLENIVVKPK